jgi:hypothetical protein
LLHERDLVLRYTSIACNATNWHYKNYEARRQYKPALPWAVFQISCSRVGPKIIMKTRGVHLQHYSLSLFIAAHNFSSRLDWQSRIFLHEVLELQVNVMRLQKQRQENVTVWGVLFHFPMVIQNI